METWSGTSERTAAQRAPAIDRAHLAQATFNEPRLEREVLQLFDRQAVLLLARIRTSTPSGVTGLAHTLKGSAAGIGAWGVARAAEDTERAAATSGADCDQAVRELAAAVDEARAEIVELLRTP